MANEVVVQTQPMPGNIAPLKDIRFFDMGGTGYDSLPKEDMSNVAWDKITLFNKEANEAAGMDEALTSFRKADPANRKKDLPLEVIGYRFGEREFNFEDKDTHEIKPTLANVLYLYTGDQKVYFIHGTTFVRNFLNAIRLLGVPSAQPDGAFHIEVNSVVEKGRNRYILTLMKSEDVK